MCILTKASIFLNCFRYMKGILKYNTICLSHQGFSFVFLLSKTVFKYKELFCKQSYSSIPRINYYYHFLYFLKKT